MSHKSRIASLLTGASLAALSLVGGRSAMGATLTGTGTATIAINTDFVNIVAPADFDLVTNNAIISDGFDNPLGAGTAALAVWITTNAAVDHFVNNKVIQAIEGTAAANNASTAFATATGMLVNGDVPKITNNGLIEAIAVAHDTETGAATASALAKGVREFAVVNGPTVTKTFWLDNEGDIAAYADAKAFAKTSAQATANALGVQQTVQANGTTVAATVWLDNEGDIRAKADALADSTSASVTAVANATGVKQFAQANGSSGMATAKLDNDGDIAAYAEGKAFAKINASAFAGATGVNQFAQANGTTVIATASLDNEGDIRAKAHARADSTSAAYASGNANGVRQLAQANGGIGMATAWLDNDGDIAAYAEGKAFAKTNAHAFASATGVNQLAQRNGNAGVATAKLDNDGDIAARAHALADSTSTATATANATGVRQFANLNGPPETATVWLDNDGAIAAYAEGKAFANTSANALANASGVNQSAVVNAAGGTATAWLDNDGDIEAYAEAKAFGKAGAVASATVTGVNQDADANEGFGLAEISLDNHGDIKAKAHALAESSSGTASADANATGVDQRAHADGGEGTAKVWLDNKGDIEAYAEGKAFGKAGADVTASATGVDQLARADDGSGTARIWLENEGSIKAKVHALADSTSGAATVTDVSAVGVTQQAVAIDGSFGTAKVWLDNKGDIEAYAEGEAFAKTSAEATVFATGARQRAFADFGGRVAEAKLDNYGNIAAKADALADSTSGAADASASVTGVGQNATANGGGGFGTAKVWLDNEGDIDAYAEGKAFAVNFASAEVDANGVFQRADADDGSGVATVWLENKGYIGAKGHALVESTFASGTADASVTGVEQRATADGVGGVATVSVDNNGDIAAHAEAKAFALGAARGSATAFGVLQVASATGAGGAATAKVDNGGTIKAFADAAAEGATATALARAWGIVASGSAPGGTFDVDIDNSGVIVAAAKAAANGAATAETALATGILVTGTGDGSTVITNDGGTIWTGWSTDTTFNRGNAINLAGVGAAFGPAPNPALIELKGNNGPGHIYGDIRLHVDDRIEVTEGKTFFSGIIYSPEYGVDHLGLGGANNSLDIFNGGNLVLCQDGWTGACDPGGWAEAGPEGKGFDPQTGVNGPSYVFIDTFTVQPDGMLTYQLTSKNTPGAPTGGDYPQVYADTANLAGTVNAVYLPAIYADQTTYEDVIVANTRNGTFDQVTDNSILLETQAIYDGNDVDLAATRTAFDKVVAKPTKNQDSVAGAIENVYGKLPGPGVDPATQAPFVQLVGNLFTIDNVGDYKLVLDQLSGAQYAQYLQSVLWSLRALDQSITDRMDCSLNVVNGAVVTGDKFLGSTAVPDGCFTPHQWQTWVRAWGGWNDNNGDVEAPGFSEDQFGIWVGADYALNSRWFVGVAGGYFDSNMDFDKWGGVSGGSIDYDGGQIALYGGWDNAVWYDRAIVKFGWYSGDSHRNFGLNTVLDPSGSPDSDVVDFYNEIGRRFAVGASSMLTPYFGITIAHAEIDGFTEKDPYGTGAALKVASSDADSVATALGLRYNGTFGAFKPQVAVAWEHEFEDTFQTVNMSFATAPSGSNFKVIGTDLDEDSLLVEAGGAYAINDSSDFSVRYVGRWLSDYDAQSIMGRYTYKFGAAPVAAPVAYEPLKLGNK